MTKITYDSFTCPVCETTFVLTIAPPLSVSSREVKEVHARQISKLKLFIEIFKALDGKDEHDVNQETFIHELLNTGKFSGDEAKGYLEKAIENGQLYERKPGFLAKA